MSYIDIIKEKARSDKKTIVMPETNDKRTLIAAAHVLEEGIANIIMVGNEEKIMDGAGWLEVDLTGVKVVDPTKTEKFEEYAQLLYETRKAKGMTLEEARQRVTELFGGMESAPTLIICDNEHKIKRLGGDHDTMTLLINGVHSYTSLSSEFLTADVLAHEMTHAETHQRIYQNSTDTSSIPIWFDEGLAVQNDYREPYSNETWLKLTDNGQNIPSLSEYGSGETFFSGSTEDRRARYCLAGHEVSKWLEKNGRSGLLSLLKRVNQGESFSELYFAVSP